MMKTTGRESKGLVNGLHSKVPDMLKSSNKKRTPKAKTKKEVTMLELKIKIIKARDLAVSDFAMGFIPIGSDPYVKVRLMKNGYCNIGEESVVYLGKTNVVEQTVNPVWDQVFTATVPRDSINEKDALFHLKLFDKDQDSLIVSTVALILAMG